jgi:dTDP-glucose pyrophosphorylase
MKTRRAVILARGLGRRLRTADPSAHLTAAQQRAADAGLKAMMPIDGRPFIDYALSALADADLTDVALVVALDHGALRTHYASTPPSRVRVSFVVQREPLGTANAILAAESWCAGEPFLAMNADNLYPVRVLADLAALEEPGLPVFDAEDLVRTSNIPAERVQAFALIHVDPQGYLASIVEKPTNMILRAAPDPQSPDGGHSNTLVSMNCWRFDRRIFAACRDVERSPRGEYELPEAVGLAVSRGMRFRAIPSKGPVLDLSRRSDAIELARRLAGITPYP